METKAENRKEYFSPEEMARWLGIGRTLAYQLLSTGEIPSFKIGRRRIVRRQDVEAWVEKRKKQGAK